jgi:hypothetical protein
MSRSLGAALPDDLLRALSQDDLAARLGRALPLITVDDAGRPHPMLVSYVELLAVTPKAIRLAVGADGSGARHLAERGAATLLVVEPERTVYVKCRAAGAPLWAPPLARFTLEVEDVLEDSAAAWEGGARITGGIVYAPALGLDAPEVKATLALLRQEESPAPAVGENAGRRGA